MGVQSASKVFVVFVLARNVVRVVFWYRILLILFVFMFKRQRSQDLTSKLDDCTLKGQNHLLP